MSLARRVEPEMLDTLPADDPRAVRSRSDLRRVNRIMGTCGLIGSALDAIVRVVVVATHRRTRRWRRLADAAHRAPARTELAEASDWACSTCSQSYVPRR